MSNKFQNEFSPNYVSAPGETLLETLETIGMTQAQLANRTGRPRKLINEIIKGKAAITTETALQFERVLGVPASFWNNREHQYRETLARIKEYEELENELEWLKRFPIKTMNRLGWIRNPRDKVHQLREVLNFFGVASPGQLKDLWDGIQASFRKSPAFEFDQGALLAWLRKGEIDAQHIRCALYDSKRFLKTLHRVRSLTVEDPEIFQSEVMRLCAEAGVAVVFIPELPKIRVSGAARWLTPNKALIQLNLRYKTDDQLWFTFFHEAGHIIRHGKRDVFIDIEVSKPNDAREEEASNFAANLLIPPVKYVDFIRRDDRSKASIRRFASEIGIAPGIVVGRLQHDRILPYSHCNDLKNWLAWAER